jgi:hypothetical protein
LFENAFIFRQNSPFVKRRDYFRTKPKAARRTIQFDVARFIWFARLPLGSVLAEELFVWLFG